MPVVIIDEVRAEVPEGTTILEAARRVGIEIPALCCRPDCSPSTSCMCCVVRIEGGKGLVPSCATMVRDGMRVASETEEIRQARRTALELLLSDHVGDCRSPCQNACPAHMDISTMIRQIAAGQMGDAIVTVKQDIALPAILGRICPAPCEPGCRRNQAGGPVAVCLLKRYVADVDLASPEPHLPPMVEPSGKRVAVVGAGPTGLATAYYLRRLGHGCTVLDRHERPGGGLRYGVEPERLPQDVLQGEIRIIERMGAEFRLGTELGRGISLSELRQGFDAVVLAFGTLEPARLAELGLRTGKRGVAVNPATFQTDLEGVFAGGGATRPLKIAVRSVAEGKALALCVDQYLTGRPIAAPSQGFNTRMGRLDPEQLESFLVGANRQDRHAPGGGETAGFTREEALAEARRCLHCDCAAASDCKLRLWAERYGADPRRFSGEVARRVEKRQENPWVVFEPGKCITCGLCVQIARRGDERLGLSFVGRGFQVRIDVPLGGDLAEGLEKTARLCIEACPTGALSAGPDETPAERASGSDCLPGPREAPDSSNVTAESNE